MRASVRDMSKLGPATAVASLAVVAIVVAACVDGAGGRSEPSSPAAAGTPTPSSVTRSDGTFELTISALNARVAPNEPITISTSLTYVGPESAIRAAGSSEGLVAFSLEEVDGSRSIHSGITSDCRTDYPFTRGVPVDQPFSKSGGWTPDDPNADFITAYFANPILRLPAGRWRIVADLVAYVRDCAVGRAHELHVPIEITVQ